MQASRALVLILVLAVSGWLSGCSDSSDRDTSAARHCFVVEDGDEHTHLVITMENPAQVSVSAAGANAQVTLGRIDGNSFVYGDGSRLRFDDQAIVGEGGLVAGIAGRRVPCS